MHNQKRSEYKARLRHDATAAKLAAKAQQWNKLTSELLKRRQTYLHEWEACVNTHPESNEGETSKTSSVMTRMLMDLPLLEKLLTVNPDPIYLWNYRRELLLLPIVTNQSNQKERDASFIKTFIQKEQELTTSCLQKNPKAYGPWFHRKWSIRTWIQLIQKDSDEAEISLKEQCEKLLMTELYLCAEFLTLDERNFHCWNYRRFIVAALAFVMLDGTVSHAVTTLDGSWNEWCFSDSQMKSDCNEASLLTIGAQIAELSFSKSMKELDLGKETSTSSEKDQPTSQSMQNEEILSLLQSEWDFTTTKIQQNFSNGSAFHYRSKLLPMILQLETVTKDTPNDGDAHVWRRWDKIQEELDLLRNAIYTEPDDQTSWWYYRFILAMAKPLNASTHEENADDELLEEYRAMLMEEWDSLQELIETEGGTCKWGLIGAYMIAMALYDVEEETDNRDSEWLQGANKCLSTLKELDPDRAARYDSMMN